MNMQANFKYLTNFKNYHNGFGKVSKGTQGSNDYRVGDKVEVYFTSEKYAGLQGVIVIPTDLNKVKPEEVHTTVKVRFNDGKEDYISIYNLNKI